MQMLEAPAMFDPIQAEPVEQLWMSRRCAQFAKVTWSRDDRFAKVMHPDPIDKGSYEQRIGWVALGQPLGECQSPTAGGNHRIIRRNVLRGTFGNQHRELTWGDLARRLVVVPSMEQLGDRQMSCRFG